LALSLRTVRAVNAYSDEAFLNDGLSAGDYLCLLVSFLSDAQVGWYRRSQTRADGLAVVHRAIHIDETIPSEFYEGFLDRSHHEDFIARG
jgi:hypothetical protein